MYLMTNCKRLTDEERLEHRKQWNRDHKEQCNEAGRRYYQRHKDIIKMKRRQRFKRNYANNKDLLIAKQREWRQRHRKAIMEMSDEEFLIAIGLRQPQQGEQ